MKKARRGWICLLAMSVAGMATAGQIVPGFDDINAVFSATSNVVSTTVTGPTRELGLTLAAQITPSTADISASTTGTVNIIEIGGTSNGSGLMIKDGNYIFVTKRGANANSPTLEDTDGSDAMLGITLGTATVGLDTKVWVSFDGGYGAICYAVNDVTNQISLTGTGSGWNWNGNNTVSAGAIDPSAGWRAGTADFGDYAAEPYPTNNFSAFQSTAFAGTLTLAQYFNDVSLIPAPPASISLSLTNSTDVVLEWTPGPLAVSYNIYRSTSSGVYGSPLITGLTGTSYVDTTTISGVEYFYVMTSVDEFDNETEASAEVSIATDTVPPAAPANLVIATNGSLFELSWDANGEGDLASYSVYRSTSSGSYGAAIATGITTNSFGIGAPELGVTTYFVVTAVDEVGNESGMSNEQSGIVTGIDTIRLFFVMDSGAVYGFDSIASNGLNTVDANRMTNGMLLATVPEYSTYQGIAILPDSTVYGISAAGDVMLWTDPASFLTGEGAASLVASATYDPALVGSSEYIHGCSYDPYTKGFYAVLESPSNPPDGDVVLYSNLTAFVNNDSYSTNAAAYGGNRANFYYGWGDVPINYTEADTSDTTGMPYFQVPGSGQIESWLTLDAYIAGPQFRKFEVPGFSNGAGNIVAAFATIPDTLVIPAFGLDIQLQGASDAVISWSAVDGAVYTVQSKDDLLGGWSDLVTDINGIEGTLSVTTTVSGAQSFYQVNGQ